MKNKYELSKHIKLDDIQSLKDFDLVEYCGGENWKINRHIVDKDGKRKWYYTSPDENPDFNPEVDSLEKMTNIEYFQESAWYFCDTIATDNAERNIHYFDYATTGERMCWKEGDEYWLVFNCAMKRFEIRKADYEKWTPLERYFIDKNLELKFKWMYKYYKDFNDFMNNKFTIKYIKKISFNSFPDRIEISPLIEYRYDKDCTKFNYPKCIFDAYEEFSSIKDTFKSLKLQDNSLFNMLIDNKNLLYRYFFEKMENPEIIEKMKKMYDSNMFIANRRYNIVDNSIEDPKKYMEIFYNYNHTYKYRLKHHKDDSDS